mmetsp:Transcript_71698/g.134093  ORF Transcript_71698/g.134093 Transcript_71698/m.134093 type:complete len:193 (-) Transcript_71698:23-601(-)
MVSGRCSIGIAVLALLTNSRFCLATRPAAHSAEVLAAEAGEPGCCDEDKDGLAERSEEVRNRVQVLQKHLNKVNREIARESVRKERLEDDMKATNSDRTALSVEAKILRGKRKKAEVNLRKEEEQAMKAAKSAGNTSSDTEDSHKEAVTSLLVKQHRGNASHRAHSQTSAEEFAAGVTGEGWLWTTDVKPSS